MFDLKKLLEGAVNGLSQATGSKNRISSTPPPASTASPRLNPQAQANLQRTQDAAQQARADVFNPGKILGDIGGGVADFSKALTAGIQQGAGAVGDVALQGGAVLGSIGAQTNPFINQQQRDAQQAQQLRNTQQFRTGLQNMNDVQGSKIVGTTDVDQNATRIAQGQGNAQDYAAVLGKGLEVGNTATMFANPVTIAKGLPLGQAARLGAKDAALFGTTGGLQGGAQEYGRSGDLGQALKAGATSALVSGATQGALDIAAPVAGAIVRNAPRAAQTTTKLVQNTGRAINDAIPSAAKMTDSHPEILALKDTGTQLFEQRNGLINRGADINSQPVRQIDAAIKNLGQEYNNTYKRVMQQSNNQLQRGSIQIPGRAPDANPAPINRVIPEETIPTSAIPEMPVIQPKTRFAAQTAPNSGNLSPELANAVRENASSYSKSTNKESVEKSIDFLSNRTEDEAINDVLGRISQKNIDRQAVTDAIATASSLDAKGGTRNLELAQNIYDRLSEQLTKAGQTVQAASIISRRTPEGMAYNATRELQRAGVPITPEIRQAIITKTNEIGQLKLGSEAREIATAELQKEVNKLIPDELVDKLVGTWKAGLLTGIRTTTGGALSNALFRGLREVSRPGAVATDMITSLFTGKRSTALTLKGNWSGTTEGLKKAGKYLKSGIDERSFTADGKYIDREINFKNKALKTYVNGVFRVMGAADRPFYYSQFKNSLAEANIVEAKNLKLEGKDFDNYVENGIKNPSDDAVQYATDVAEQSVLGNDTLLSNVANKLREAVSKQENAAVRGAGKLALGVLAPFTKVPSAFLTRVVDFTPIGAVKEAVQQMANKTLNQQKLVQAISEAGTGTGLIYLGAELANNDLLTGNYPNDQKEQARWRTEGIIPNAVKVGDTYYSLNYAGPVGALFGIGKSIADTAREGGDVTSSLIAGATQLASGTLEQSFLSGISGALDAVQDPKRYAENFARSQAGSVIPTLLNDVGNATDETQRQANNPLEAIQSRIPGARTGLNEKLDSFGNPLEQANPNQVGRLIDPLRPSKRRTTPVTDELDRLAKAGQSIFPANDKTIQAGGKTLKLDGDQQNDYNGAVGKETEFIWQNILNNDVYKGLTDEEKKKTLENSAGDLNAVMKKAYLYSIGENEMADAINLTKRQEGYALGTIDPLQWIPKDSAIAKTEAEKKKTEKAVAKATKAKKASAKKGGPKKGGSKYDYSKRLEETTKTQQDADNALRKLVYASKITRKKIGDA